MIFGLSLAGPTDVDLGAVGRCDIGVKHAVFHLADQCRIVARSILGTTLQAIENKRGLAHRRPVNWPVNRPVNHPVNGRRPNLRLLFNHQFEQSVNLS
jgi:hypothetical protein